MSTHRHSSGFAEDQASFEAAAANAIPAAPMRLRVGPGGRVVVPAEVRKQLGIETGDLLLARIVDGDFVLTTVANATRRIQAIAAKYKRPGVGEVDEFLAQRRAMWGEE
ncbi:AbrB/MazE/SpoVT family DNA-binding domain-containing protein [Prosthecodimorpha staleyi]|uniref:AbrB/MazE/SpoVT family DNA-binding domain-containing protein n=1 Tax=Prosthecodimorpha staleyi TaxID=2840188 RepID=A0A947D158_9HYPH|nr:AbrB/MazE/SpoVT family DNA-binding domain-containing protein [Prosthecodimorpha staleyi]MBT9289033.1 AbrB/MazE/SpoVT family DNA-binding domain-containing protein [Prosthecodimorpha staleyi]